MIRNADKAYTFGLMVEHTMATGKMVSNKALVFIYVSIIIIQPNLKLKKEHGTMVEDKPGAMK